MASIAEITVPLDEKKGDQVVSTVTELTEGNHFDEGLEPRDISFKEGVVENHIDLKESIVTETVKNHVGELQEAQILTGTECTVENHVDEKCEKEELSTIESAIENHINEKQETEKLPITESSVENHINEQQETEKLTVTEFTVENHVDTKEKIDKVSVENHNGEVANSSVIAEVEIVENHIDDKQETEKLSVTENIFETYIEKTQETDESSTTETVHQENTQEHTENLHNLVNDNDNTNSEGVIHTHIAEDGGINGIKPLGNDPRFHIVDNKYPNQETWTLSSNSQILFESDHYNNFHAYGNKAGTFHPGSSKLCYQNSSLSNCQFAASQGTSSVPLNGGANSMNYNSPGQHVVHLHVNPGETVSFLIGDQIQLIHGPATVRMVSNNSSPPVPMPIQVPPGHMVQQLIDEHGTLRHIILSPQPPVAVTVGNPYNAGTTGGTVTSPSGSSPFYLYHPSYTLPIQFPPHMQPVLGQGLHSPGDHVQIPNNHCPNHGLSDSSSMPHMNAFKDDRTQRQFFKLKRRLEARQKDNVTFTPPDNEDSSKQTSEPSNQHQAENGPEENNNSQKNAKLLAALSTVGTPVVSDITPTSALMKWSRPDLKVDTDSEIKEEDLSYTVFLSDKNKDPKPKSVYQGKLLEYALTDLKPATLYYMSVRAEVDGVSGNVSELSSFKTLSCKPDTPLPPKLFSRTKTSIFLKWNAGVDNGSKIQTYILEYDEGTGTNDFVELFNGLQKQYKAVKLKTSTCYRFRIASVNEHGKSSYSEVSCFSTSGSIPSQPSPPILKEAFINRLRLEWESRPNDDGYTLQMEDERTFHGFLPVYNGKEAYYTCLNLKRNSQYKFRLRASNDEGSSPWSQVVTFSTIPDKPDKPGKPYLKGRAHSASLKLNWDPPKDDGGCAITEYVLEINNEEDFREIYHGPEAEYLSDRLQPGKLYNFRVKCVSPGGTSGFSDVSSIATASVVPGQCRPPKLHGKPKALSLHLKWSNPESDGGSEILEYEVEVFNPDNTSRLAFKGHNTDCVVAGLQPGRQYQFHVRAYNKVGAGQWSELVEVTSGAGVPDMPFEVQAVPRSPHCVFVSWSEPMNNGAVITEYRLESKHDDNEFESVHSGSGCSAEIKSLIPSTCYFYQVQAINSAGPGPFSEPVECQTPSSSPGTISTANIRHNVTATSITLFWKAPNNHGSPILSYNVEVGDTIYTTDGENPEITIESLVPETAYKVRIQAINGVGPGPFSSSLKINTRGLPPPPPILECSGSSYNSLRLKWGDGRNLDLRTYTLELENPHSNRFVPIYQGTGQSFKVSRLNEKTPYNFRIYASNDEGDGHCSEVFMFETQRALPPALKAPKVSDVTETSCVVEWIPAKPIGDDMLSYKLQLGSKESDFQVVYTGIQTSFTIQDLTPGTEYSARLAVVRHCSDAGVCGPFSPCTTFCTNTVEPAKAPAPKIMSVVGSLTDREPLTDQQWAVIILCSFTCFAVIVAIIIERILSYTKS